VIRKTTDGTDNNPVFNAPTKPGVIKPDDPGKNFTNPLKLHVLAGGSLSNQESYVEGQVCLYVRGVGGMSCFGSLRKARFILGRLSQQTNKMLKMFSKVYEEGDEVYIIGFSRGASSARKFATILNKKLRRFDEKPVPIKFLGCFDTVSVQTWKNLFKILSTKGELTKSSVLGEKNGKLPSNVDKAVHFVSMDDGRFASGIPFPPVLMDSGDDRNRVLEIWFPGVHGDVGGNFWHKGLSDTTCKAMQEHLKDAGITFITNKQISEDALIIDAYYCCRPDVEIDVSKINIDPDAKERDHINKEKHTSHRTIATVTNEEVIKDGVVKIHVSVLEHMKENKNPKPEGEYNFNPEVKTANVVIVDNEGNELKEKTAEFKKRLGLEEQCSSTQLDI
jgi:hypothetical protein